MVVPEDPFLVGGFLKKLYLPKVVKAAQLYPKVHPFVSKKLKTVTGPFIFIYCSSGATIGGYLVGGKLTLGLANLVAPVVVPGVIKKFCPKFLPLG